MTVLLFRTGYSPLEPYTTLPDATRISDPGLYAWVPADTSEPCSRGVLYWGVGLGIEGVDGRLDREFGWVSGDFDHGHGSAMHRLAACPVRARVTVLQAYPGASLRWLDNASDLCASQVKDFLERLYEPYAASGTADLSLVEQFVIRFSIQAGQTGAPVQSQYASAWATRSTADWAAYAAARRLEREHLGAGPTA